MGVKGYDVLTARREGTRIRVFFIWGANQNFAGAAIRYEVVRDTTLREESVASSPHLGVMPDLTRFTGSRTTAPAPFVAQPGSQSRGLFI